MTNKYNSINLKGNWFHQSTVLMTQMKQLQVNRSRRQINTTEESKKTK